MNSQHITLRVASEQGGVVRRDQAIDAGFSRDQIDWRVRSGEWELVGNGAYRLLELAGRKNLVKAAAAILPAATVSHYSAAALHNLKGVRRDIVSVTVASRTTHSFPDVRVFRNDDIAAWQRTRVSGLVTTTAERTIVDLAGVLSKQHTEFVTDGLLDTGRCEPAAIRSVLDSVARRGKPGVTVMRGILDRRSPHGERQTPLENAGNALLIGAGLPEFETEYPIPWSPLKRFDAAFVPSQVAIEWDSRQWHMLKLAFQSDRERDRLAMENGWRIVRFTWRDVHDTPSSVVETVRAILRSAQPV